MLSLRTKAPTTPSTPQQFGSRTAMPIGTPLDSIAFPSPSPWKVLLLQRSESEPYFGVRNNRAARDQEQRADAAGIPTSTPDMRSMSVPHISSSSYPSAVEGGLDPLDTPSRAAAAAHNGGRGGGRGRVGARGARDGRGGGGHESMSRVSGNRSAAMSSATTASSGSGDYRFRTPRTSSAGRPHAESNVSSASDRTFTGSVGRCVACLLAVVHLLAKSLTCLG